MHHHKLKLETLYLHSGKLNVEFEDGTVELAVGEKMQIQRGQRHRLVAVEDSEVFEVSTTHHESDSYREPVTPASPDSA